MDKEGRSGDGVERELIEVMKNEWVGRTEGVTDFVASVEKLGEVERDGEG
jgi:hypothetical protein